MTFSELGKKLLKSMQRENSELDFLIKTNTELHRKGFARIALKSESGDAIEADASIHYRQLTHEYRFGANLFMLEQFPEAEKNARFEERFTRLFNLGVVPFYWSDLEPVQGRPRYAKDSPHIYRRPAPDLVLEFCGQNQITPKGHPLFWHGWIPDWMPKDRRQWLYRMEKHIAEIAERYGDKIFIFDAINEVFTTLRHAHTPYPNDIVPTAFKVAERYLPHAQLVLNDDMWWWNYHRELTPYYMVAKQLLEQGLALGGLGFQYHMFEHNITNEFEKFLDPAHLYRCLDQYGTLGIPCSLSEISISSRHDLGDGDAFQNVLIEKLYRLWFSHPATEALIYWNTVDGTAAGGTPGGEDGENSLRSGLLNYDLSPKASYATLDKLINEEWRSSGEMSYRPNGDNRFQGFYGDYELIVDLDGRRIRRRISLSKHASRDFSITLDV